MKQETIAKRLRIALDKRGMKQSELAQRANIGKSGISQYLSGYCEPKQLAIYHISRALGISEAWLMGYDVPMEKNAIEDILIFDNGKEYNIASLPPEAQEDLLKYIEFLENKYLGKESERNG